MPILHDIQAVTFDVGGTLLRPWPSVGTVYADVAAGLGWNGLDPLALDRAFIDAWRRCRTEPEGFDYSQAAWARLVCHTFTGQIGEPGRDDLFQALWLRFTEPAVWRLREGTREVLTCLRAAGLRVGLVSNWDIRLRPLLQRLELIEAFDAVSISAEVGAIKPDPALFRHALEQLALPADRVVHVGDNPREDGAGARATGLRAWLL